MESAVKDSWSRLEAAGFRARHDTKHRWTYSRMRTDREAKEAAREYMRVKERNRDPKPVQRPTPNMETYLFSDHVLDLAAEGAPGVRLYDEADKELWNEKWSAPSAADTAARERLLGHVDSANDAARAYQHLKATRDLRYLLIRDPDILSLALRGGPGRPTTAQEAEHTGVVRRATADLLHRNGIPRATWGDDATVLWWMEGRAPPIGPRGVKIPDHQDPEFAFRHGRFDYGEFRRILSVALASGKGFIAPTLQLQKQVALLCRDGPDKPAELHSSYSTLTFLMDVQDAVRMGNDVARLPLIRAAIEHSAGGLYVDIAHDYLSMADDVISDTYDKEGKPDAKRLVSEGVSRALSRLAINVEAAATCGAGAGFPTRTSLIKLLTGFGSDLVEAPSCFMGFMAYRPVREKAFQHYVGNLARLGALRSVWLLWQATTRKHYGELEDRGPQLVEMFSRALMNAKDAIRSYRVKQSKTPDSPAEASRLDCLAMADDITKRKQSAVADIAEVELSPEIPFQITAALELETPEEAIEKLKQMVEGEMIEEAELAEEEEPEKPEVDEAADSWEALESSSRKRSRRW